MIDHPQVIEICQRVLGWQVSVQVADMNGICRVVVSDAKQQDALTRSQQEMDIIMSLQHLLGGVAIQLVIE